MRKSFVLGSLVLLVGIATTVSASLLGVSPGFPNFSFRNATTTQTYDPGTQTFSANSILNSLAFFLGDSQPVSPAGSDPLPTVAISIQVDNSGNLTGAPTSRDIVIRGTITDPSTSQTYTGDLLTGSVKGFGFQLVNGTTSVFDFDFGVTGGTMASYFAGQDIAVVLNSEASTFTNSFAVAFNGHTKGNIGPIPNTCTGSIGDFVWRDLNLNGIQDSGEPGIDGVKVQLKNSGGSVLQTTMTGVGPANQHGYYQFTGVCAGSYTVVVDSTTLPAGVTPTASFQGNDPTVDSNGSPASVTLATNSSSDQTIDFGYFGSNSQTGNGTIGDFVWNDLNGNGIQDAGEPGIAGVTVNLYDSTGTNQLATTVTGPNGNYAFTGLNAGTYVVKIDATTLPAGFVASPSLQGGNTATDSNGSPATVTLSTNTSTDNTIDFGYIGPGTGSIGDFVWHDMNQNGIQDAGEPGIDGVTVTLKDSLGNVVGTAVTGLGPSNQHGYYQFTGLHAGTYMVSVTMGVPAGWTPTITNAPGSTTANDSNSQPAIVTLSTSTSSDQTIDFGYNAPCTGSIGDFVWSDLNGNGIQDAGEPGIDGVTLNLRKLSDNSIITTTTTSGGGLYSFGGVCPGSYKVEVITPNGYVPTIVNAPGSTTANDSNPNPSTVTLPEDNSTDTTIDFGFQPRNAAIGDFVWKDLNGNGIQDAGEPGIPGVTVNISGPGGFTASTTTDANGAYHFTGLAPGSYTVTFVAPTGYVFSPQFQGSNTAVDSNANASGVTPAVTLAAGQTDNTIDAGLYQPGAIGDFVWNDLNDNGVQDSGEPGIGGVTVTLMHGSTVIATTTTATDGSYHFTNVAPGTYTVNFTAPSGYVFSPQFQGGNTATDSNPNASGVATVTIVSGQTDNTIDAGLFQPPAAVGDFVWNDLNGNGIQDAGEPGLQGVQVNLYNGTSLIATTTSDANGAYHFTGLAPGTYTVQFIAPNGYVFSPSLQGSNRAVDSNPTQLGVTSAFTLVAGQTDNTIDAGLMVAPPPCTPVSITANFNGTAINAGSYIWVSAVAKVQGIPPGTNPTINITNASVHSTSIFAPVPNGTITLQSGPGVTAATTFNTSTNTWVTTVPQPLGGNYFLTAVAIPVTTAVAGGQSLTFTASYTTDTPGVTVNWQFAAAVYTSFTTNYTTLGVKPVDDPNASSYKNSDHAGTPENYKGSVTGGAMGGGGSNFTGSLSSTLTSTPCTAGGAAQCVLGYPYTSSNPLTSVVFNESGVLAASDPSVADAGDTIRMFAADEHAILLGVRTSALPISALTQNPGHVSHPSVGDPTITDPSGRPIFPSIFVTDITGVSDNSTHTDPTYRAGDWQYGGTAMQPSDIFGTWKGASKSGSTLTTDADPSQNQWNLGSGSDVPSAGFSGLTNQGYGAEVRWNVNDIRVGGQPLQFGHQYRIQLMVHDGDQNQSGGDVGEACMLVNIMSPIPSGTGTIGNFVWSDTNGNGIQDAGEPGLPGVTVQLSDSNGNVVGSTVTDSNGNYLFTGLATGNYTVTAATPAGYTPSPAGVGGNPAIDSNGSPATVSVTADSSNVTVDFGFVPPPPPPCTPVAINDKFNASAINAGNYIWFTATLKPSGIKAGQSATVQFTNGSVQSTAFNVPLPNAKITFSATATTATTVYDASSNTYTTVVPATLAGNTFLTGVPFLVSSNIPGALNNVSMTGSFTTDTTGVNVSWQWEAAVYSTFNSNPSALGIKPVDDPHASTYQNNDHAGTPENYRANGVSGATGGGGPGDIGAASPGQNTTPCVVTIANTGSCVLGYPFSSSNPLTSVVFNESTVLDWVDPSQATMNDTIRLFAADEHAILLGVHNNNLSVSALPANPGHVTSPSIGDPSVTDPSGRPIFPSLFITDITGLTDNASHTDPTYRAGDWQFGGAPQAPNDIFGTWKGASVSGTTITTDADPTTKNNWTLGTGSDTPSVGFSGLTNEGYGAEVRWNVNNLLFNGQPLQPGHTYRIQLMVHDGDQNKSGGDVGQACATVTIH